MKFYVLDESGLPRLFDVSSTEGMLAWSRWFMNTDRRIALDLIEGSEPFEVSTVFTGVSIAPDCVLPQLYETAVFDGEQCVCTLSRYATREDAIEGHLEAVFRLRALSQASEMKTEDLLARFRERKAGPKS